MSVGWSRLINLTLLSHVVFREDFLLRGNHISVVAMAKSTSVLPVAVCARRRHFCRVVLRLFCRLPRRDLLLSSAEKRGVGNVSGGGGGGGWGEGVVVNVNRSNKSRGWWECLIRRCISAKVHCIVNIVKNRCNLFCDFG